MGILSPPWTELPADLTANIFGRLEVVEILESVQRVCTTWWKVCKDHPSVWRVITIKNDVEGCSLMHRHLPTLCRIAVDRSQGQLIELTWHEFGDNELLNYIVDRSSKLRSLKLHNCSEVKIKWLAETVKKLPQLEELHLIHMETIHAGYIETIGISCPMLKTFMFTHPRPGLHFEDGAFFYTVDHNSHALAIAKTMPNLHRLFVLGHLMKSEGFEAILDGCPHLEWLDLQDQDSTQQKTRRFKRNRTNDDEIYLDLTWLVVQRSPEKIKQLRRLLDLLRFAWSNGL